MHDSILLATLLPISVGKVKSFVRRLSDDLEVRYSVIGLVAVLVMYFLGFS